MNFNSANSSHSYDRLIPVAVPIDGTYDEKSQYGAIPSAPPLEVLSPRLLDEQREQVRVDRFRGLSPSWSEREKTCRIASRLFLGSSILLSLGATAVGAGVIFTASPYIVLGTTAGLVAGAIASGIAAKLFNPEGKKFLKDPDFLLRELKGAEKDIEENRLSYRAISMKYQYLLTNEFIKAEDFNRLFSIRIADPELSYGDLREQLRGISSSFSFGFTLSPSNREILREKVFAPSWEGEASMTESEIKSLMINPQDIASRIAHRNYFRLLKREISYECFKTNVANQWGFFTPEELKQITPLAFDYYVKKQTPLKDVMVELSETRLDITLNELIEAGALSSDIALVEQKKMEYREFRERHGVEAIRIYQSQPLKGGVSPLEEAYCSSYRTMHDYASDARLFNIDDIGNRMERKMLQELEHLHSFEEVIERFGESVFQEKRLTLEHSTLRGLITLYLKGVVTRKISNSYQMSPSSPLVRHNLITDSIQIMLENAQKEEGRVLQNYASKKSEVESELQLKRQEHDSSYNSSIALLLPPINGQIQEYKGRVIELKRQRDQAKSSVAAFEQEARNQEAISRDIKLKESEYRRLEGEQRRLVPLDLEILLSTQRVLTSKKARKGEVEDLLGKALQIDQYKAEINKLTKEIEAIEAQLNVEKEVSGVINALSSISEKRTLEAKRTELAKKKGAAEQKLEQASSAKQREVELKRESAALSAVETQLIDINEKVRLAQEQKRAADKKQQLQKDITALRNQVKAEPGILGNGINIINQVNLASLETQVTEFEQKIKSLSNSRDKINIRLKTERDTRNQVAQEHFDRNIRRLEGEKKKLLDDIKERFLAQLSRG